MFRHINVSCPMKFTYVVVSATIYCSCMLLKLGLYVKNSEAHVIVVSLLYLEHIHLCDIFQ